MDIKLDPARQRRQVGSITLPTLTTVSTSTSPQTTSTEPVTSTTNTSSTGTSTSTTSTTPTTSTTSTTPTTSTTSTSSSTSISTTSTPSTTSTTSSSPSPSSIPLVTQSTTQIITTSPTPTQATSTLTVPATSSSALVSTDTRTNTLTSQSFFHKKGEVAGVFTAAGLAVLVIVIAIATNIIRRRRAKRFDDEIASAAAAAYAQAEAGPRGWDPDEDTWRDPSQRAYTSSSGGHTSGTYGAHNAPPVGFAGAPGGYPNYNDYNNLPPAQGGYGYPRGEEYGMEEFPPRNDAGPFADPVRNAPVPGLAGVSVAAGAAAFASHGQNGTGEVRYRGPPGVKSTSPPPPQQYGNEEPYAMGMMDVTNDSGRYPMTPARSRSINYGNGSVPSIGRSASQTSIGHPINGYTQSYSQPQTQNGVGRYQGPTPFPSQGQRLPHMQEQSEDVDPYDGMAPDVREPVPNHKIEDFRDDESEYGIAEDAPRVLRIANA